MKDETFSTIAVTIVWLVVGAFIVSIIMGLCGCAMLKHTDKDGNETIYFRAGNQTIGTGSIDLPGGGKLTFEGQESKLPHVKIGTDEIVIGGKEVVK